jgi:hypothetical protein
VATTTISLPDEDLIRLRQHALRSGRSLDEIVREAVNAYLAQAPLIGVPAVAQQHPGPSAREWQAEADTALARIHARVPQVLLPAEIEAEITEASEEARQERIAHRDRARRS